MRNADARKHDDDAEPVVRLLPRLPDEPLKRLNVNLPLSDHAALKSLARAQGVNMTELVKWSLDVARDVLNDADSDYRLVAVDRRGQVVKQYVLPY